MRNGSRRARGTALAAGVLATACGEVGRPAPPPAAPVQAEATYQVRHTPGVVYGQGLRRESWEDEGGEVVDLTLDVREPTGAPERDKPVLVCIHGGDFAGSIREPGELAVFSKEGLVPFAEHFASRGWVVFSIDYRMAEDRGNAPPVWFAPPSEINPLRTRAFYTAARDTKAAVRWIHARAGDYGASADHIALLGGSGGAALAVAAGFSDPEDFTAEIDAAADPTLASTHLDARSDAHTVVSFWGSSAALDLLEKFDGRNRFDPGDPPLLIVQGTRDAIVPLEVAKEMRQACLAADVPHDVIAFDGGHGHWNAFINGRSLPEVALDFVVERQGLEVR